MMQNMATDAPDIDANDFVMAMNMANRLHSAYPGHLWAVTCEGSKGIATIRNLALSGTWGYVLRLPTIYSGSEFEKRVLRAGGEILERYHLARGKLNEDHLGALPTNFAGHHIADK